MTGTGVAPTATFAGTNPVDEGSLATLAFINVFDPSSAEGRACAAAGERLRRAPA